MFFFYSSLSGLTATHLHWQLVNIGTDLPEKSEIVGGRQTSVLYHNVLGRSHFIGLCFEGRTGYGGTKRRQDSRNDGRKGMEVNGNDRTVGMMVGEEL